MFETKKFLKRNYYTLSDLLKLCDGPDVPKEYLISKYYEDGFKQVLMTVFGLTAVQLDNILTSTEVATLWSVYIAPYRLNEYITYKDDDTLTSSTDDEFVKWVSLVCNKIKFTYERYKTLLDIYSNQKANLLNAVSTVNTVRFNDTPQNGGDFSSDSYTTTYTKSQSESDVTTLMARIAEIDASYKNVYASWAKEFDNLFFSTPEGD